MAILYFSGIWDSVKIVYNITISTVLLKGIKLRKTHNRHLHENIKSILHIYKNYA